MEGNSLAHYGILGMKWGVRKDPSKAGRKATNKLRKIDAKRRNAEAQSHGYTTVASKARLDARMSVTREQRKENKKTAKLADKLAKKSMKQASAYAKKGEKWASKMTEILGNTKMNDISKLDIDFASSYGFDYKYKR